ncbi:MAG: sulfite exporter TauE/SafE family protein [Verrucomicrobiota bacterium JB023]|nr:sulfite exporter TauE/SafE family protein [Verrucomicrobiota bacterium JB023]
MESVATVSAALIAGLVTSVHCVGMCGPIACTVSSMKGNETSRLLGATTYHLGRLLSYGSIGALCGLVGEQPLKWIFNSPAVILPWFLVAVFVVTALGLWKQLPKPAFLNRLFAQARMRAFKLSATHGGFLLGLATPILPCGPLYLLFAACLLTGDPLRGAEFALAFGLGTVPLLWIAQQSLTQIKKLIPATTFTHLQRGLALVAAGIMLFRLQDTLPMPGEGTANNPEELPSCCHAAP